jgi:hypothetical protein
MLGTIAYSEGHKDPGGKGKEWNEVSFPRYLIPVPNRRSLSMSIATHPSMERRKGRADSPPTDILQPLAILQAPLTPRQYAPQRTQALRALDIQQRRVRHGQIQDLESVGSVVVRSGRVCDRCGHGWCGGMCAMLRALAKTSSFLGINDGECESSGIFVVLQIVAYAGR